MKFEQEIQEYLGNLKPGERVVETSPGMMHNIEGTVYLSEEGMSKGCLCVLWETKKMFGGKMGTSTTWGTRRLTEKSLYPVE